MIRPEVPNGEFGFVWKNSFSNELHDHLDKCWMCADGFSSYYPHPEFSASSTASVSRS